MAEKVILTVGTRRGLFLLESSKARRKWTLSGPFGKGWEVRHAMIDTRSASPRLHAAVSSFTFGSNTFHSGLPIKKMKAAQKPPQPPKFPDKAGEFASKWGISTTPTMWVVEPGPARKKKVLYAGCAPAGLFRSGDGGNSWEPVRGLNEHPSRKDWMPGAGGMCAHSIQIDPHDENRMWVAVSAAGTFRTDDGGKTWNPKNDAVAKYVGAPEDSQVGTCVHRLLVHPTEPGRLYQQNHVGVYRSDDHGDSWYRIDAGLPYDFGFGLALDPHDPETCFVTPLEPDGYAFRATDGALCVYRLNRNGRSWKKLSRGLPSKNAHVSVLRHAMTSDAFDPCGVYLGTGGGHVFASPDRGESWSAIAEYLPPVYSLHAAIV